MERMEANRAKVGQQERRQTVSKSLKRNIFPSVKESHTHSRIFLLCVSLKMQTTFQPCDGTVYYTQGNIPTNLTHPLSNCHLLVAMTNVRNLYSIPLVICFRFKMYYSS